MRGNVFLVVLFVLGGAVEVARRCVGTYVAFGCVRHPHAHNYVPREICMPRTRHPTNSRLPSRVPPRCSAKGGLLVIDGMELSCLVLLLRGSLKSVR